MLHIARPRVRLLASIAIGALSCGLVFGACGGSSDGVGDAAAGGDSTGGDPAGEVVDGASDDTSASASGEARATVVLNGTTYEFVEVDDPDESLDTYCTVIAGSLQGELKLLDESGAEVEDAGVTFTLFEPDSDYADEGVPQDITIELPPSDPDVIGPITYLADGDSIDSTTSGRSSSASFTAPHVSGEVSGTIDVSC